MVRHGQCAKGGGGVTTVTVIGAGKMGLPIACQLAARGAMVRACDLSEPLVARINRGECPFDEPGMADLLARVVQGGNLIATTNTPAAVAASEVVIVLVPVLLTPERRADLQQIHAVARQIGSAIRPGSMVIFETTLPVGSTRALLPLLEAGGRRAGVDFDLVYSPERVKSRSVLKNLAEAPKVVGGLTPDAAARATAFYREFLGAPVIDVGSPEAAEFVKLAGMVYRDVNIALANELARYADEIGVDFAPIAAAANTDGEAMILTPGVGVGGHCTPVYPYFLLHDAERRGVRAELTSLSRRINDDQPREVIARLESTWGPVAGKRAMILGLGFRPEVKEHTCSPAFLIQDALVARGSEVELCDPLYTDEEIRTHGFVPGRLEAETAPDVLVLATGHRAFVDLDFKSLATRGLRAVIDGRNLWNPRRVAESGIAYIGVGRRAHAGQKKPAWAPAAKASAVQT